MNDYKLTSEMLFKSSGLEYCFNLRIKLSCQFRVAFILESTRFTNIPITEIYKLMGQVLQEQ